MLCPHVTLTTLPTPDPSTSIPLMPPLLSHVPICLPQSLTPPSHLPPQNQFPLNVLVCCLSPNTTTYLHTLLLAPTHPIYPQVPHTLPLVVGFL